MVGAQPAMEIVAKENMVTIMDHRKGERKEEIVDDPMSVPRRFTENWKPQRMDELPEAFCGELLSFRFLIAPSKSGLFRFQGK